MHRGKSIFTLSLILLVFLSACSGLAAETQAPSVTKTSTQSSSSGRSMTETPSHQQTSQPLFSTQTPNPTELTAELNLKSAMEFLRDLSQKNKAYKTTAGWLHTLVEIHDVYHQYAVVNPDDPDLEITDEVRTYFTYHPPNGLIESWIELDGNGMVTGNRLIIQYDMDKTPLYAMAENFDHGIISVEVLLNPDVTIGQVLSVSDSSSQSADRSVARLNDIMIKVVNHFRLYQVEFDRNLNVENESLFALQIEDRTEMTLDLSYFPEPVIGFVHTLQIDNQTGECRLYAEDAVGTSGKRYPAYSEATQVFEVLEALPEQTSLFYDVMLQQKRP